MWQFREGWEQCVSGCCNALCCFHITPISVGTICLLGTFFFASSLQASGNAILPGGTSICSRSRCSLWDNVALCQPITSHGPFRDLDGVIALAQLHLGCGHCFWSAPGSWLLTLIYASLRAAGNYMHVLVFRKLLQSPRSEDFFMQHQENELFLLMGISDTLGHVKRPACVFLLVMEEGLVEEELIITLQLWSQRVSVPICWCFVSQNTVCRTMGLHSVIVWLISLVGQLAGICCLLDTPYK